MSAKNFYLNSTVKSHPRHPYNDIKDAILGKKYELSLTFIGTTRAQKLNVQYRKKNYTPNVLSFPLDSTHGEIYICPQIANKEAHEFNLSQRGYVGFLFIHGLLHLKGYKHGAKMETLEKRYLKRFAIV